MASRSYFPLIILLIFATLVSCEPKEEVTPAPDPFPSLRIYADRFVAEARARGYELNISNMDIAYVDEIKFSDGTLYCGYGWINHPNTGKRTVLISKSASCGWANMPENKREQFFFHEMGHAFLNLKHDNSLFCDGKPVTLMNSNAGSIEFYDQDNEARNYYIDELFNRLAPAERCMEYGKDFAADPVFFRHQGGNDSWIFHNAQGGFAGSRITQNTPFSLVISSVAGKISQETGYWYSQIQQPHIPEGAKVTLRTKVYSEGLTGPGVAIGLRVYEAPISNTGAQIKESRFLTTENAPISGILNGQTLELTIPNFTRKTIILIPFAVMMPGTEGEVRFEDFEIIVEE